MAELTKQEPLSPEREKLEVRLKEIEIDQKLQDLESSKRMDDLQARYRELENKELEEGTGFTGPLDKLLMVAKAVVIDNDKTLPGSEPAVRSLWDEEELEEIKKLIMKKARKL